MKNVESSIKENTKAVIMTDGSNVCGTLLPIDEIGQICRNNNIILIVDSPPDCWNNTHKNEKKQY